MELEVEVVEVKLDMVECEVVVDGKSKVVVVSIGVVVKDGVI